MPKYDIEKEIFISYQNSAMLSDTFILDSFVECSVNNFVVY